jgi:hypothetical protein
MQLDFQSSPEKAPEQSWRESGALDLDPGP